MTDIQQTFLMLIAFGSFVVAIIFGILPVVLGILNLIKKK